MHTVQKLHSYFQEGFIEKKIMFSTFSLVNLQFRSRAPNWSICQHFAVFCTFVTNAKVKGPYEMSMMTFNLSNQLLFSMTSNGLLFNFTQGRQIQSPVGTQNEGDSKHFAIVRKSTFQRISGGNCWLHSLFIQMKLKVTMHFFNFVFGCTYLHCAPAGFATYLP